MRHETAEKDGQQRINHLRGKIGEKADQSESENIALKNSLPRRSVHSLAFHSVVFSAAPGMVNVLHVVTVLLDRYSISFFGVGSVRKLWKGCS